VCLNNRGTALRADVVICTYTLDRWEVFARSVESVARAKSRPTAADHSSWTTTMSARPVPAGMGR